MRSIMNIHSFKLARKYSLEDKSLNESTEVNEFIDLQYENALNEGIISSIVRWYKQNFSPRAVKMKRLGKEYYDWLSKEYSSMYKEDRWNDTPVESFLKKETPSGDIEIQLKSLAKADTDYTELAGKIILENKIKAKKDFCKEHLGPEDKLTKKYADEEAEVAKDVQRTMKNMSRRDASKFEFDIKTLRDKIAHDGLQPVMAAKIASGISIFCQVRKLRSGVDFTAEDLWDEYAKGEKDFMKMHPKFGSYKGVEFMYSIRCLKTPDLLKLEQLDAEEIQKQVAKTVNTLKSIGVEWENEAHWGLVQLYLMQRDQKSQQETLATIKKKISSMTEDQVNDFSNDVQSDLEDIRDQNMGPEEEERAVDNLESKIDSDQEPETNAQRTWRESSEKPEEPKAEAPDANASTEEPAKKEDAPATSERTVRDRLASELRAKPIYLLEGLKDYLFAVATAVEKNDKYTWNPAAKKTITAIKFGINKTGTGIPKELIDNAISYLKKGSDGATIFPAEWERPDLLNQKTFNAGLDPDMVKKAAQALYRDYLSGLDIWGNEVEKADPETQKAISSRGFFASLFKDKGGSIESLKTDEVKEKMKDTFTYYL